MSTSLAMTPWQPARIEMPGGRRSWTVLDDDGEVVECLRHWIVHLEQTRASPNTIRAYVRHVVDFANFLGANDAGVHEATVALYDSFLAWRLAHRKDALPSPRLILQRQLEARVLASSTRNRLSLSIERWPTHRQAYRCKGETRRILPSWKTRGMFVIDAKALRNALGNFATGVTIVTTCHDGRKIGLTANSFNSVSLDPPLVLWSLAKKSSNIDAFMNVDAFAVHILGADQEALSNQFATPGIDKFEGVDIKTGEADVPLLRDCAARFECRTAYRYDGGDHIIFVGEVLDLEQSEKEPLLFHRGKYARKTMPKTDDRAENARDLNYLVARAYFMLTDGVREQAAEKGLSQVDHYALSVLLKGGPASLSEVNGMLGTSGWQWTETDLQRQADAGLVQVADHGIVSLTKSGRETMIGLFAQAKAVEADAQKAFSPDELDQLRSLLSQLLETLDLQVAKGTAQHLEAMNALQADQPAEDGGES